MSFLEFYVGRRTHEEDFPNQIDQLIDWKAIERDIMRVWLGCSGASGLLRLLAGIWNGSLSDKLVGDMANLSLHAMRFLGLGLEDDVPDHLVLSCFGTCLTTTPMRGISCKQWHTTQKDYLNSLPIIEQSRKHRNIVLSQKI